MPENNRHHFPKRKNSIWILEPVLPLQSTVYKETNSPLIFVGVLLNLVYSHKKKHSHQLTQKTFT